MEIGHGRESVQYQIDREMDARHDFVNNATALDHLTGGRMLVSDLQVERTLGLNAAEAEYVDLFVGMMLMQEKIYIAEQERASLTQSEKTGQTPAASTKEDSTGSRLLNSIRKRGRIKFAEKELPFLKTAQPVYEEYLDVERDALERSSGGERVRIIEQAMDDILLLKSEGDAKPNSSQVINRRFSKEYTQRWAEKWRSELAKAPQR